MAHKPEDVLNDRWKPIPGWEMLYEVSSRGVIRSLDRIVVRRNGTRVFTHGRILATRLDSKGYNTAVLLDGSRKRSGTVARMVAVAFLGIKDDDEVDHIDRNRRNDTLSNLRVASRSQNSANRGISIRNTSGAVGVSWSKRAKKWTAQIKVNGKQKWLGQFSRKDLAVAAYRSAAVEIFGEFAP